MNEVKTEKKREPLFHIVKRNAIPFWKSWLFRVVAIVAAVVVCSVVTVIMTDLNPISVWDAMFKGSFKNEMKTWWMLRELALLLGVSLAVTPAFKMRFWNCGAEGQVLMGALCSYATIMFCGDKMSYVPLMIVTLVAALLGAAIWGVIPAIFFAFFKTNETLFTLMMNYVAKGLITFCVIFFAWENVYGSGKVNFISTGILPMVYNNEFLIILIIAIMTLFMYIYLNYTKQGYEISVVGESENTANYIGINVKKVVIRTMLISGAICGIVGFLLVTGRDYVVSPESAAGRGFTAIMVSWLAKFNPIFMILTSFLVVFFQFGTEEITKAFGLNEYFSDILIGIVILFIIGSEFFINYRLKFRKGAKEVE